MSITGSAKNRLPPLPILFSWHLNTIVSHSGLFDFSFYLLTTIYISGLNFTITCIFLSNNIVCQTLITYPFTNQSVVLELSALTLLISIDSISEHLAYKHWADGGIVTIVTLFHLYASPSSTREGAGMGKTFNSCLNEHQIDCSKSPYEVDNNWFYRERFSKVWNSIMKDRSFFTFKEDIFPLQLFPWFQRLVVLIFLSLSSPVTRLQSAQWHHIHTHTHETAAGCMWLTASTIWHWK